MMRKIVVGVDGSIGATTALRWAAEEAELHGTKVTALLAWWFLRQYHVDPLDDGYTPDYGDEEAQEALASYVRRALGHDDGVESKTVCNMATAALVKETQRADLVVVGARGTGGFEGLLVGSTTNGLVERASGPVAVVGAPGPVAGGRVVVGIDGSVRSTTALRWAAEEAKARRAPLDVVHAWKFPTLDPGDWMPSLPTEDEARQRAEDLLTASLADPALSGVEATRHLSAGGAAHALLERCEGAGLVVVGARDLGPVAGWFLGSVSRQLLHHAPCPVVLL